MELYLVSKASQEESRTGVVEAAETNVFGIFTTEDRADAMAEKHDAHVTEFVADKESMEMIERWLNPGYSSS